MSHYHNCRNVTNIILIYLFLFFIFIQNKGINIHMTYNNNDNKQRGDNYIVAMSVFRHLISEDDK